VSLRTWREARVSQSSSSLIAATITIDDMPVVQFAPFASLVQPGFWHELTRMKIDVLRLSEDAMTVNGSYSVGRSIRDRETGQDIALGCNLTVGEDAYQKAPQFVAIGQR
jgi:hypothetical protein